MSNQVASLLAKLDTGLNKKKGAGKKDWAAINEARKKAFWKPKDGKNEILVFTPSFSTDPFMFWGFHKNLQEVDYYSIPCDHYNKQESCLVCEVYESLKSEDWEGNKHLWMPIEQKTETYVPMIDLTSPATIAEGPRWFRVSKTIMNVMVESLRNLEDGEVPFFDQTTPQRVIINYDKNQAPATQYSVSFKPLKNVPTAEQYAEWAEKIQPVSEFIYSKSQDEVKKLVDEYFARVAEALDNSMDEAPAQPADEAEDAPASKLSKLKGK